MNDEKRKIVRRLPKMKTKYFGSFEPTNYEMVKRTEKVAMYRVYGLEHQTMGLDVFLVHITKKNPRWAPINDVDAQIERFPYDQEYGSSAWSFMFNDKAGAESKFRELEQK